MGSYNFGLSAEPLEGNSLDKASRGITNSLAGAGAETFNRGSGSFDRGFSTMQPSVDYWTKLLTGNRGTAMNAIAPAVHAVTSQAQQQQQALAQGPRGGGTASALTQLPQQQTAMISQLLSGAQAGAASPLAQTGAEQSRLGLGQQQLGLQSIQDAIQALLARRGQNITETGQNKQLASNLATQTMGDITKGYLQSRGGG